MPPAASTVPEMPSFGRAPATPLMASTKAGVSRIRRVANFLKAVLLGWGDRAQRGVIGVIGRDAQAFSDGAGKPATVGACTDCERESFGWGSAQPVEPDPFAAFRCAPRREASHRSDAGRVLRYPSTPAARVEPA
jgi:hypothetical protein